MGKDFILISSVRSNITSVAISLKLSIHVYVNQASLQVVIELSFRQDEGQESPCHI